MRVSGLRDSCFFARFVQACLRLRLLGTLRLPTTQSRHHTLFRPHTSLWQSSGLTPVALSHDLRALTKMHHAPIFATTYHTHTHYSASCPACSHYPSRVVAAPCASCALRSTVRAIFRFYAKTEMSSMHHSECTHARQRMLLYASPLHYLLQRTRVRLHHSLAQADCHCILLLSLHPSLCVTSNLHALWRNAAPSMSVLAPCVAAALLPFWTTLLPFSQLQQTEQSASWSAF